MRVVPQSPEVELVPGRPTVLTLEVTNELSVIDGVTVSIDAGSGLDVVVTPPLLPLFPDGTGRVQLSLSVSPTFAAGARELAIEVRSSVEPPSGTTITVPTNVVATPRATLTVVPPVRSARHRTSYSVLLDNTGNTVVEASLAASDAERLLRTVFRPGLLVAEPGATASATLLVQGRRRFYGRPLRRNLDVVAEAGGLDLSARVGFDHGVLVPAGVRTVVTLAVIVGVWAAIVLLALGHAFSGDQLTKDVPPSFYAASPAAQTATGRSALGALGTYRFENAASTDSVVGAVPKSGVAVGIGGTVTGNVTSASTHAPAGRVTVQAVRSSPAGPSLVSSAATGTDGSYVLSGLLPGDYAIEFTATGVTPVWWPAAPSEATAKPVTVVSMGQTSGIDAVVTGLPASIVGSVVTASPTAVPVTVTVLPGQGGTSPIASVTTAVNGTYTIPDLPAPGTYDLSFSAPGFKVASDTESVTGGETHAAGTVALTAAAGAIGGTVTDGSAPLGGVTVTAAANGKTYTTATPTSGAVGTFSLPGLPSPATYLLTFTAEGYGSQTIAQPLGPGQTLGTLAVAMAGGAGQVSGTVTSATGAPLGGVNVTVNGGAAPVTTRTLTAGQVGTFVLSGLATPRSYTLTFSQTGYSPETLAVSLSSSGSAGGVAVQLARSTGDLAGTVVAGPSGAALPGATVAATDGTTKLSTVTTSNPAGAFSLSALAPGSWTVTCSAPGYAPSTALVQVVAGHTATSSLALQPGGS